MIEYKVIKMRRTEEKDLATVLREEQRLENATFINQWSYEEHLTSLSDPNISHGVFENASGKEIGYVILNDSQRSDGCIELMRLVIYEKGEGYGKLAISLIKKWAFQHQKAHRLWLDVKEENMRAQHVYTAQGFVKEGLLRECIKEGDRYQSLILMAILEGDYQKENVMPKKD